MMPRGSFNARLSVQQRASSDDFVSGGGEPWVEVRKVWAEVQDVLPSRSEREDGGFTTSTWRARVRMDFRSDINAAMRFVGGGRTMQIVGGPARVENLDAVEFMVEEYSAARGG